jgi:hypothetical protein
VPPAAAPAALPATISRLAVVEVRPEPDRLRGRQRLWTTYATATGRWSSVNARRCRRARRESAGRPGATGAAVDETSGRPSPGSLFRPQEAEHMLIAGQNSLRIDMTLLAP